MDDSAFFQINGAVLRKWIVNSGKFATIDVETSINGRRAKHKVKLFDHELIARIESLGQGEVISIQGDINVECLKDKSGNEVLVNNYKVWMPSLIARKIDADKNQEEPRQRKSQTPRNDLPPTDDDIPF